MRETCTSRFRAVRPAFLILLSVLTFSYATADTWADRGAYDISWYDKSSKDFYLSTPQEVAGIAYLVNNGFTDFWRQSIHLTADINLSGKSWIPISTQSNIFQGNFDGAGYTISDVNLADVDYSNCGFWREIKNGTISDLTLSVWINSDHRNIGAVAATATCATFRNLNITNNINLTRGKVSGSIRFEYCIGGVVGKSTDCKFYNVNVDNDIKFRFGSSAGDNYYSGIDLDLGGIVGYATDEEDIIDRCQANNRFDIGIYGCTTVNSPVSNDGGGTVNCGGIAGCYAYPHMTSCLSNTEYFKGYDFSGTYKGISFHYGGIAGKVVSSSKKWFINNCVGITKNYFIQGHDYTWVASWYKTDSTFAGIVGNNIGEITACYSNNDVKIETSKIGQTGHGKDGSTSYTAAQMNTPEFVDELNLYNKLNGNPDVWCLDENGKLSIIDETKIKKQDQVIAWSQELSGLRVGDKIELNATASSGLGVTYAITDGTDKASIFGNVLTCLAPGEVTVTVTQLGNDEYNEAPPVSRVITIAEAKKEQTIEWTQDLSSLKVGDVVELDATATSGLPITYIVTAGNEYVSLEGYTLTCTAAGNAIITAIQSGSDDYMSAEPISRHVQIAEAIVIQDQTIEWDQELSGLRVGDKIELNATASSGLGVTYAITDGTDKASIFGNVLTCLAPGEVTVTVTQLGNDEYNEAPPVSRVITIAEAKKEQTIEWTQDLSSLKVGDVVELDATATSGLPITYIVTAGNEYVSLEGYTLTCTAAGNAIITAIQPGSDDYLSAEPVSRHVQIAEAIVTQDQTIEWSQDLTDIFVDDVITLSATATSGLPITYFVTSGNDKVALVGDVMTCLAPGQVIVTAFQYGDSRYNPATPVSKVIDIQEKIAKAEQTIVWDQDLNGIWIDDVVELQAKATSGLSVIFNVVEGAELVDIKQTSDNKSYSLTCLSPGQVTITASQDGNDEYAEATPVTRTLIIQPKSITVDGIIYTINTANGTASVGTQSDDIPANIVIADLVEAYGIGYRVTKIANMAFYKNSKIKSVSIPQSITRIGFGAFDYCENLSAIELHDGLGYLSTSAFGHTAVEHIHLPKTLKVIEYGAFTGCSALIDIDVDQANESFVSSDGVLYTKDMKTLNAYPGGKTDTIFYIPESVSNIIDYAVAYNRHVKKVTIPSKVKNINSYVFDGCESLEEVVINGQISEINDYAFCDCAITDFELYNESPDKITVTKQAFDGTPIENATLYVPAGSAGLYAEARVWRDFGYIVAMNATSNPFNPEGKVAKAVDMGLSCDWAEWNVGASAIGQVGGLYYWGDPSGETLKYDSMSEPALDDISGTEYDIAHNRWGGNWRMPTFEEWEELINCCEWYYSVDDNGNYQYEVQAPNGNTLLLPSTGWREDDTYCVKYNAFYHSSTLNEDKEYAWGLAIFDDDLTFDLLGIIRECALAVRPVCDKPQGQSSHYYIIGNPTDWLFDDKYNFLTSDKKGVYEIRDVVLTQEFAIVSDDWLEWYGPDNSSTSPVPNTDIVLNANSLFYTIDPIIASRLVFDYNAMTLRIETKTGITDVSMDSGLMVQGRELKFTNPTGNSIYTLDGRLIATEVSEITLQPGVYLVTNTGRTVKVYIK